MSDGQYWERVNNGLKPGNAFWTLENTVMNKFSNSKVNALLTTNSTGVIE
jgi:hypothetical protein